MKNSKTIITILITLIIITSIALAVLVVLKNGGKKEEPKEETSVTENGKIIIKFDVNGEIELDDIEIDVDEEVNLPVLAKEGYIFEGWFVNNQKVDNNTTFSESVVLKAKWKKIDDSIKTFKVTFDSKGGNTIPDMVVECDKELSLPGNPVRNGYSFVAWIDRNGTPILNGALLACEDITLYADWKENPKKPKTYNIVFDTKGGTSVRNIIVECDTELTLPANPTKDGYDFISWVDKNGTPILNGALLTCNDITLYANWQKKETSYSCPNNYELDGTNCVSTAPLMYDCPAGTIHSDDDCISTTETIDFSYTCSSTEISLDKNYSSSDHVQEYTDGIYLGNGECAYHVWSEYQTEQSCNDAEINENKITVWRNGVCYASIVTGRDSKYCIDGYKESDTCYKIYAKEAMCDNGYEVSDNSCIKTIPATAN